MFACNNKLKDWKLYTILQFFCYSEIVSRSFINIEKMPKLFRNNILENFKVKLYIQCLIHIQNNQQILQEYEQIQVQFFRLQQVDLLLLSQYLQPLP